MNIYFAVELKAFPNSIENPSAHLKKHRSFNLLLDANFLCSYVLMSEGDVLNDLRHRNVPGTFFICKAEIAESKVLPLINNALQGSKGAVNVNVDVVQVTEVKL